MNNEELTNLIIKQLGKLQDRNEIIQKVCEQSSLDWNEARKLVEDVATQNKKKIHARQSPMLVFLSIGTLLLGIGFLAYNTQFLMSFFQKDTVGQILSLQSSYYQLGGAVTGLGMTVGGFYGLWKTIATLLPD